ncbi:Nitrogen fixation protein of unknown function [Synechococcus sp. MIT S9509]|uniref:Nif11-like leader peptide family natural product precursor n=1 Tax=unclassified Synechococcus TaxID=2626047 RepID=UPI0007BBF1E3|nr:MULTISPECIES: Nif11-like leader peptide family natural product precursor [unclassified Synechococcus]KZR84148.1 Nitrogen fixation protein of unknown function [Synechococcus sp. MIT S9504]KZR88890.1 Nitrogen fixation protein of unknown function [Synechococcus sp. MIT S9509]
MSEEQLKSFLEKVKADSNLQEKLKAAKSPEDVVGIAKEHGHEFTCDKISRLREDELEGLAGGGLSIWGCTECVDGTFHCKRCDLSNLF